MADYVMTFDAEDRDRVFCFFALFSRWERALNRSGFAKPGRHGQAETNWNKYAHFVAADLANLTVLAYVDAREFLVTSPPKRQRPNQLPAESLTSERKRPPLILTSGV